MLARVTLVLVVLMLAIWILRIILSKTKTSNRFLLLTNRFLRKNHKGIGIAAFILGMAHGFFSSEKILSINIGSLSAIFILLLGLHYIFKKKQQGKTWRITHKILALLCSGVTIWHIVAVGGFVPSMMDGFKPGTVINGIDLKTIPDGSYYGMATGYRPGIRVKTTVAKGRIISVVVVTHKEQGERYYSTPIEIIPQRIVEKQSVDVDIVSGATKTSKGIMKACEQAFLDAVSNK